MKIVVLLFSFLFSFNSFAIRHVGNGGGEAELKALTFAQFLPYWTLGCNTNIELCWNGSAFSLDFISAAQKLQLKFVNANELTDRCNFPEMVLSHEELYQDFLTPKSDQEISLLVIKNLMACLKDNQAQRKDLHVIASPVGFKVNALELYAIRGQASDILFAKDFPQNLHQEILNKTSCAAYRITDRTQDFFSVRCQDQKSDYLVKPVYTKQGITFVIRYLSDID